MSYAHKLQYAGAAPYKPEQERDDIDYREQELLEQDDTYQKLAAVRYLADELESDGAVRDDLTEAAHDALFDAVAVRDAPLQVMVEEYVDAWLAEHRDDVEVSA